MGDEFLNMPSTSGNEPQNQTSDFKTWNSILCELNDMNLEESWKYLEDNYTVLYNKLKMCAHNSKSLRFKSLLLRCEKENMEVELNKCRAMIAKMKELVIDESSDSEEAVMGQEEEPEKESTQETEQQKQEDKTCTTKKRKSELDQLSTLKTPKKSSQTFPQILPAILHQYSSDDSD